MDLKEIVNREKYEYHVDEMVFVFESYIKIRKNRDIKINLGTAQIPMLYVHETQKLQLAFDDACQWLKENNKFE
jgi:hypothetical protein